RFSVVRAPTTPEIYTLSLHDALPIWGRGGIGGVIRSTMASPTAITRGARRGILGLPESLPFQFFDDQTVVGRASASRAEQIAVRVPHRVRTLPPAESTQGVRRGHDTTQK